VSVLRSDMHGFVFVFGISAQQNYDLGPPVLPVLQPLQLATFLCEGGCGFPVPVGLAAIGLTHLVHRDIRNLLEELHTKECLDVRDELEHSCPTVLVVVLASLHPDTLRNGTHSPYAPVALFGVSGRAVVSDVQPGQVGDALEEPAKVFHLVPTRQFDSRNLVANTSEILEES